MTKIMNVLSPSIADILFTEENITHHQIGIDTIRLTPIYKTLIKLVERLGLQITKNTKGTAVSETVERIKEKAKKDFKKRYNKEKFSPVVEVVKLTKGKSVSNYMIVIRNIPLLFDIATYHKKSKDTYCMVVFTGLHQPTKKVESEAMKIISTFTKRKTFKLYSLDIAIDTNDHRSISYKYKESFKDDLMPYSKHGVTIPPNGATSYYLNRIDDLERISRILYYDKYFKETQHHNQKGISNELCNWKRLEVTVSFDVTKRENKGFTQYIEGLDFVDDICSIDEVARLAKIKTYDTDYLIYQINSLLDNRFMNNHESMKQFNSVESLERFKMSDFRRYVLAI